MGNCAFGLEDITARKAGCIFGYIVFYVIKHSVARHDALCCKRKHSDGRQNASSFCASIVTADRVRDAAGWNTLTADRVPDTAGRSTLTADTVLYAARWSTPTADKVPSPTAEILQQPTEYFRNLREYRDGRKSTQCDSMENYNSRQSTQCVRIEYTNGRQSSCHDGRSTLTAVGISHAIFALSYLEKLNKFNLLKI